MKETDIAEDLHFPSEDPAIRSLFIKTIARLPEAVQAFAVKRCLYVYAARDNVQVFSGYIACSSWGSLRKAPEGTIEDKAWEEFRAQPDELRWRQIVVLGEITGGDEEAMLLIAVGIAHAFSGGGLLEEGSEEEERAKELARGWGFRSGRPRAGRRGEGATPP